VISLLAGAASASQSTLVEIIGHKAEKHVPLVIGLFSMLISILNSISSFLKIPALTEQNLQSHLSFEKLSRKIQAQICVRPIDRKLCGREAHIKFESEFQQLLDISPPVSVKTEKKFTKRRDVREMNVPLPSTIKMTKLRTFSEIERDKKLEFEIEKEKIKKQLSSSKSRKNIFSIRRREQENKLSSLPPNFDEIYKKKSTIDITNISQDMQNEIGSQQSQQIKSAVVNELNELKKLQVVRNIKKRNTSDQDDGEVSRERVLQGEEVLRNS
jgi:hypothetical protein